MAFIRLVQPIKKEIQLPKMKYSFSQTDKNKM